MTSPKSSVLKNSADIFEKMFAESKGDIVPERPPLNAPVVTAKSLDIRNVKISDSFATSIIESAFKTAPKVVEEAPEQEAINEEVVKNKLQDLVVRLAGLIQEAKTVLHEMTTTGMLGTNQKFLLLDKKKNGSNKSNKRK